MEQKEEKLQKAYEVSEKSEQGPEPKRSLFGYKCPKCGTKLERETAKGLIFAGEGATEFAKKVAERAELSPGVYNLAVNHFKCKCGYEYAKSEVSTVSD
ncbi:MAG: hypothetical protein Q7R57_06465 [Dehalococcoidales bacterium]|nr:hypothetical protein [Dehalococcoidales bacterium]